MSPAPSHSDSTDFSAAMDRLRQSIDIIDVISKRGVRLVKKGAEHIGRCPFHDDRHESLNVNGGKRVYLCRACGATGDAISFIMDLEGRTFGDVVHELSGGEIDVRKGGKSIRTGHTPRQFAEKPEETPRYVPVFPVPAHAPDIVAKQGFSALNGAEPVVRKTVPIHNPNNPDNPVTQMSIAALYPYKDMDGALLGYVVRVEWMEDDGEGGQVRRKITPQVLWCKDIIMPTGEVIAEGWCFGSFPLDKRLPYGSELAKDRPHGTLAWFEGEKSRDAGERLLGHAGYVPLTWVGGAGAVDKMMLAPELIIGRDHLLCPDNDHSGVECMERLAERIREIAPAAKILVAAAPETAPKKWDLADALDWSPEQAVEWAEALPLDAGYFFDREDAVEAEAASADAATTDAEKGRSGKAAETLADVDMTGVPGDCIAMFNRILEHGPSILLDDTVALMRLLRFKKSDKDAYANFRKALRMAGVNVSEAESRSWLALQGVTPVGMSIHSRISAEGADVLADEDVMRQLILMRSNERSGYTALKKALRLLGIDVAQLDKDVSKAEAALPQDEEEGGMVPYQHQREMLDAYKIKLRALGHYRGVYYYLSNSTREIVALKANEHRMQALLQLAKIEFWESAFPTEKSGADWGAATSWLMLLCHKSGLFDADQVRGRGAWEDDGRRVVHLGDKLIIDGAEIGIHDYDGRYVYERGMSLAEPNFASPVDDDEGQAILDVFQNLRWENPLSGILMAGWTAGSMICGALDWRPHAWLTGESGSGKTWIQTNVISPLLSGIAMEVASSTTEAGIRQGLGCDAVPVMFDEAESEDHRSQARMQTVFELARQSSSESNGVIRKGSAGGKSSAYRPRSMFLMTSVGVSLKQQADVSRFVVLNLAPPAPSWDKAAKDAERSHFERLQERCDAVSHKSTTGRRLFARMIGLIPKIRQNATTFTAAASKALGSQRSGDQIGTLLACAWALGSEELIDLDTATQWIKDSDFTEHEASSREADQDRCKRALLQHQIRVETTASGTHTRTIGELIAIASRSDSDILISDEAAELILTRIGIKPVESVKGGKGGSYGRGVVILNDCNKIAEIFEKTPWAAGWSRMLRRLTGSVVVGTQRFGWSSGASSWIPLDSLLSSNMPTPEPPPSERCVRTLMDGKLDGETVSELIKSASEATSLSESDRKLLQHGLKIAAPEPENPEEIGLYILEAHKAISGIFLGTEWQGGGWNRTLASLERAETFDDEPFDAGQAGRALWLPLATLKPYMSAA